MVSRTASSSTASPEASPMIENLPKTFALLDSDLQDLRIPSVEALPILTGSPVQVQSSDDTTPTNQPKHIAQTIHPLKLDGDCCSDSEQDDPCDSTVRVVDLSGSAKPLHDQETTLKLLETRPFRVSVTVSIASNTGDVGIEFARTEENILVIYSISGSGFFSQTPLRVGDQVVSINGIDSSILREDDPLLSDSSIWTIVIENPSSSNTQLQWTHLVKPRQDSRLGLGLMSQDASNIRIQSIAGNSLLEHSLLSVGDRILYLNQVCCFDDMTVERAARILQSSQQITLVTPNADTKQSLLVSSSSSSRNVPSRSLESMSHNTITTTTIPRPGFVSATIMYTPGQDLGMDIQVIDESLVVTHVDPLGPLAESPIRIGDLILSINHVDCRDCTSLDDVNALLQLIQSDTITFVLQTQNGDPSVVASMVTKPSPESMVGIVIRQRRRDGFRRTLVSKIVQNGLLHNSLITVGDRLLAINGHDCSASLTVHDAVEYIKRSKGVVTIMTQKTQGDVGAVIAATGQLHDILTLLTSVV